MIESLVTTLDNPFDPFDQFDSWYEFDTEKGYNTCQYLARVTDIQEDMSEYERKLAINNAVNDICRLNILGIYKKVSRESNDPEITEPF